MAQNNPDPQAQLQVNSNTYLGRFLRWLHVDKLPFIDAKLTDLQEQIDGLEGGDLAFNGNRTITRQGLPQVNPGGTNLKELIENYFYPKVTPTLSLTLNDYLVSKGESLDLVISGSATLNDATVDPLEDYLEIYDTTSGTDVLYEYTNANSITANVFDLMVSKSFKLQLKTTNLGGFTTTTVVSFVSPMFFGVTDAGTMDQEQIEARLTKITATQGNTGARQQLNFTANGKRMFFAYPKAYGALTGIIDPDNSNVLAGFIGQRFEVTFNWDGYEPEEYYVYFNDSDFTAENFKLTFNY